MDSRGVAGVGLVVAGGDGPELLQLGEGVLDQVAPAVHVAVEVEAVFSAGFGRDHRRGAAGIEVRPDPVHIERLVAEQGVEIQTLDQAAARRWCRAAGRAATRSAPDGRVRRPGRRSWWSGR